LDAALIALVPNELRAELARAMILKSQFSPRQFAIAEAANIAKVARKTASSDDAACQIAVDLMAAKGWQISVETIRKAEFERRYTAVNRIRDSQISWE
jgi:hypothetical protein